MTSKTFYIFCQWLGVNPQASIIYSLANLETTLEKSWRLYHITYSLLTDGHDQTQQYLHLYSQ